MIKYEFTIKYSIEISKHQESIIIILVYKNKMDFINVFVFVLNVISSVYYSVSFLLIRQDVSSTGLKKYAYHGFYLINRYFLFYYLIDILNTFKITRAQFLIILTAFKAHLYNYNFR